MISVDTIVTTLFDLPISLAGSLIIAPLILALVLVWRPIRRRQRYNIALAHRIRSKLLGIDSNAARLMYLRKIDPFVFEELMLNVLQSRGYKITRNKRYTGDGGIDGRFVFNGHQFFVQAKRYANHINAAHVKALNDLCHAVDAYGLFVHTGRTGKMSNASHYPNVMMLSGDLLVQFIASDEPVKLTLNQAHYVVL